MKDSFNFKTRSIEVFEDDGKKVITAAVDVSIEDLSTHMTVYATIPHDEKLTISQVEEQLVAKAKSKLKAIAEFI
ncbi:hypothetical protein JFN85_10250 [Enterobacter hormaechei subsp. xiangfangensis]|uniref:hypothetical protein n=1 Tax=Enterobacter hormaechei TaxID=158836 RepID=UPI001EFB24BE|nr:hypothetical protein [Enterobacter hormaechei]ULQ28646.1 hypothetical protein JFN83_10160 [Enterobacter hormaechei subsp. xiangfangensis]ULQ33554.1 hypothetical protein JFN85_10250 [Enterobacter hormaechei subsp. xiangfangensis]